MSISAETLLELSELRLEPEQMAGVLRILARMEAKDEERRQGQRDRTRRHRELKRDSNVTVTSQERDTPPPKEKSPTPPKEITPSSEPNGSLGVGKARANGLEDFKRALVEMLGAERLDAFVATRRAKRAAFTGHAANLFLADAASVGMTPAEAADTCISRNWITVKPEYLTPRARSPRSTDPPRERTPGDVFAEIAAGTWKGPLGFQPTDEPDYPTIETGYVRRN